MSSRAIDYELQIALRADNKKALEEVYTSHRKEFLYYFKSYSLDEADILDIYQDSIVAMHQKFVTDQLELKSSSIKTYLFGIGKNKIFKKLKSEQRFIRVEVEKKEYDEVVLEEHTPSELQLSLAKRLEEISESCQNLLKMFYYRNLTIDEIVELTHYKDGSTVRSQKSRCLRHLKSFFKVNS